MLKERLAVLELHHRQSAALDEHRLQTIEISIRKHVSFDIGINKYDIEKENLPFWYKIAVWAENDDSTIQSLSWLETNFRQDQGACACMFIVIASSVLTNSTDWMQICRAILWKIFTKAFLRLVAEQGHPNDETQTWWFLEGNRRFVILSSTFLSHRCVLFRAKLI